jgi:hypothetical protein
MASALLIGLSATCQADVFRWDNGQRIQGTEGFTPGPGIHLAFGHKRINGATEVVEY